MRFYTILMLLILVGCVQSSENKNELDGSELIDKENMSVKESLTREQCAQRGGVEIGDIGDGRIHRADYLCPNKQAPLGVISYIEGQVIAIEGSVCCGQ